MINRAKMGYYTNFDADGEGKDRDKDAGSSSSLGSSTRSGTNSISGGVSGVDVGRGVLSFLDVPHVPPIILSITGRNRIRIRIRS